MRKGHSDNSGGTLGVREWRWRGGGGQEKMGEVEADDTLRAKTW